MNPGIRREESTHGEAWDSIHGGYFSDPRVAAPLVAQVRCLAVESKADRIIDLGGGNGFVLRQIRDGGIATCISLLNLESSDRQISAATAAGISCARGSVDSFARSDLGPADQHLLFIMRSVLHYFGEDGLLPVIRHMRGQSMAGEYWVHQTASFKDSRAADCLNALYGMMRTGKWYPTVNFMTQCLADEGWNVRDVIRCDPLVLTSGALGSRYGIDRAEMLQIRDRLTHEFPATEDIFKTTDNGFCACLHYWIYVCTPAHR